MKYFIALFISLCGFTASYQWLKPNYDLPVNGEKRQAVAKLVIENEGVQKMPAGQAFWLDVQDGSELYEGDSLRTNDRGSANVVFLGSETILQIQPHTRFIVERKDDKFVVGDVQGNLFVENSKGSSDVQISAGGKTIDVTDGKAQINVSEGQVDLAVKGGNVKTNVNGQESLLKGGQSGKLTDSGFHEKKVKFLNVRPVYDEYIYLKDEANPITFSWEKLKGDYELKVHIGKSPQAMAAIDPEWIIEQKENQASAKLPLGEFYWKIVGINKKNRSEVVYSDIYRFHSKKLYSPNILNPQAGEVLKFQKDQPEKLTVLSWGSASPIARSLVEVAKDPEFKNVLHSKDTDQKSLKVALPEGNYYWRVSANLKNSTTNIRTKTSSFQVKFFNAIFPPKLMLPSDNNHIYLSENKEKADVTLNWERVDSARAYRLLLTTKRGNKKLRIDKDLKDPTIFVQGLAAGVYEWKVATIARDGKASSFSPPRSFTLLAPERIDWLGEKKLFEYVKQPEIKVAWKETKGAKNWKVSLSQEQSFQNALTQTVAGSIVKLPIQKDGIYHLKVEALNEQGKVIASSPLRTIQAREKPLPQAPKYHPKIKEKISADRAGRLVLAFEPPKDPKERIIVKVVDQKGEIARLHRMKRPTDTIEGLMPGRYYLNAYTLDEHERRSPSSESIELRVPENSQVAAPQIEDVVIR